MGYFLVFNKKFLPGTDVIGPIELGDVLWGRRTAAKMVATKQDISGTRDKAHRTDRRSCAKGSFQTLLLSHQVRLSFDDCSYKKRLVYG